MNQFTFTLERQALLTHYIELMHQISDKQHENRMNFNPARNAEVQSLTADALNFRDQHGITIAELNAFRDRNAKKATSVAHAFQLLSRSA